MKLIYIFFILLVFPYALTFSQINSAKHQLKSTLPDSSYKKLGENNFVGFTVSEKASSPVKRFIDGIPNGKLFNEETLNILFVNKLGTAFGGSNDLSLQEFYLSLDANDNSLSLAYNFDNRRGNELKQLNWVYSFGAKLKSEDNFSIISNSGNLQEDNIGLTASISLIGNGKIKWKANSHRQAIEKNREFLNYQYNEKVKEFNKGELEKLAEYENTFSPYGTKHKGLQKSLNKKSDELYLEMIKEDLKFIEENKSFSNLKDWWATLNFFVPLGDINYDITPITSENKATKVNYYAFDANLSFNGYKETNYDISLFGKVKLGVRGNNNIAVNNLEAKPFQSILDNNGEPEITSPVSAIEIDSFDKFITQSIKVEGAIFFKNFIGFSPAIEKNFGTYDGINWKLGIPLSLKDKEGKPTVNFELQWREDTTLESSIHRFGISTNFQFGKLIKKEDK